MILRLLQNNRGQFAVLLAIMMIPLIGLFGLAVDTALSYRLQQDLQVSLEAAVSAAVRTSDVYHRSEVARGFFESNWTERGHKAATDGSLKVGLNYDPKTKILSGTARARRATVFMQLFGIKSVSVEAHTQIHVSQPPAKVDGGCDRLDNGNCISHR